MALRLLISAAVMFALGVAQPAGDAKKDAEKFEGTWLVAAAEDNGLKLAEEQIKGIRITFTGEEFSAADGDVLIMKGTFSHDPTQKVRTIDLKSTAGRHKGKTALAIYQFDGDTLKICMVAPGEKRPTEFRSTLDNAGFLLVCKREP